MGWRRAVFPVVAASLLVIPGLAVHAQQASVPAVTARNSTDPTAMRTAMAVRAREAPRVDGQLDEEIWALAPVHGGFWQVDPDEGEPGTQSTEFRVVYSDVALFIGVRAWDSEADEIVTRLARRDEDVPSDWIVIGIDSY